jgi:enoyl-CoA hydratase/carnithine racemase
MTEHVRLEVSDGVLQITLSRPEKKNALTRAMYAALVGGLDLADRDSAIRVVLLTSSGDSYSAGNDIADFRIAETPAGASGGATQFGDRILRFTKPIVAAVNGLAVGIGATMLLHCDIVFAAEGARFRFSFVDLGLVPELASSLLLPRVAGFHRAAELFLLGRFFTAAEAREIGLVNRVLPSAELLPQALDVARAIAAKPVQAVAQTRALLKGDLAPILAHKAREDALFRERCASPEAQAIFAAFLARSSAIFSGRSQ